MISKQCTRYKAEEEAKKNKLTGEKKVESFFRDFDMQCAPIEQRSKVKSWYLLFALFVIPI